MNTKRLARTALAVIVTVGIVVAIIVGCGPKWGNGSALHQNEETAQSSNSQVSVTLPSYYMENMVFQRNQPLVVKGTVKFAHASEQIDASKLSATLAQGKMTASATAKIAKNGSFTCTLNAQKASLESYSLQVKYDGKVVTELAKVYVGDVFVAAGQSNMELNYAQYYEGNNNAYNFGKGLVKKTDLPKPLVDKNVKFVIADHDVKNTDFPLANVNLNAGAWLNADSTNSLHLSYLTQQFALQLRAKHPNVPVGIIQTAWGGTPIRRHIRGGDIYANHIAPLKDFHVAGVLWYQGCDDAMNFSTATEYESQMTALINQYRSVFGRKDLPFLYVQLARWPNYQYTQNVREAQRTTLDNANLQDRSNVAMTVSLDTDKGTSALIHPLGKDILGARMAAQYLAMENGTKNAVSVPNGPLIERARHTVDGKIALSFQIGTASGLKAMQPNYTKSASASAPDYTKNSKATPLDGISNIVIPTTAALQGFEVANSSGQWVPANAIIRGNQVALSAANGTPLDNLSGITQVRYLFSGNPKCASILYNSLNLPASPFITIVE
ncbi:sialate O-acetylesterase [Bifidobacterium adolescentis]|uniref:sialate O-acetylesterase n=1 Tax=Bifidobacterium adolescentis TaxID=1680 RepID=UPI0023EB052C|nr:sialate O-acetylesterase [Bifidobacterium adolescentis]MDF4075431.1 sialate O-acetylesterase [Bifidobacterium adolescentis]